MASEVTKRLRDRRRQVWEQCKTLAEDAANENRAFSAEEQGSWEVMNEEMDTLDRRIKSALDAEKRSADADAAFDAIATREKKPEMAAAGNNKINDELRSFLRGDTQKRSVEIAQPASSRV